MQIYLTRNDIEKLRYLLSQKNWCSEDFFKSNFTEPVIFENISIFKLILTEITAHNDSEKYEIGVLLHNMLFLGAKDG